MEACSITIHDVKSVKLRDAEHLDSGCCVRQMTIRTTSGVRFTFSMFADDPRLLDIVKE